MNISFMNNDNLKEVYYLINKCNQSEEDFKLSLKYGNNSKIIGLVDKSILIGYGVVEVIDYNSSVTLNKFGVSDEYLKNSALLSGCLIEDKYRGNRLQTILISEREKYVKNNKCTSILSNVSEYSIPSKRNLINCGYSILGSRIRPDGEIIHLLHKTI